MIYNLALTDISMATLHMPFWVISLYTGIWTFSGKWCEFQAAIAATLVIASILNMGLIAFNRHIRVVKPALYSRLFPNKRMARFYCAVVWITAILLALEHRHCTAGARRATILNSLSELLIGKSIIFRMP